MIHVIIGAPCSGKSTYVREHKKDGDVTIDFDKMAQAFGSTEPHSAPEDIKSVTFKARDAAIAEVCERKCEAWIIHTKPTAKQREMYDAADAEYIEMDTDIDTCLERCAADERPPGTEDVIRDYFGAPKGAFFMPKKGGRAMNIKTKTYELKAENGSISGYAATWIKEPDSYGDVIAKGAFAECLEQIKESGKVLPLLFNHNADDLDKYIGKVTTLEEDDHGLKFEAVFDDTPTAQRARELAIDGRLAKFSFAYDVLDQGTVKLEDGREANELRKLNIHEVSLVMYPANPDTSVIEAKGANQIVFEITEEQKKEMAEALMEKLGRRNSAKDEGDLEKIADLAQQIVDVVSGLMAVEQGPQDDTDDDNAEDQDTGEDQDNDEEQDADNAKDQGDIERLIKEADELLTKGAKA